MEIRHLKLIKAIVEEGSITKAIDKLHLTQSALSHQLKEAEYQLGTPIFLRTNKKLVLTKAGEKIYELANEILNKLTETESQIKQMVFGEYGEIRISTECFSSYHWLPSVLKQFHLLYPNVELKIVTEATHIPLQKLLENTIDIAIVSDTIKDHHIKYTELFQDEVVVVISENHPWAGKKYVVAEDFVNEHLIIHSLPMETVTIHQYFLAPAKVSPKKITPLPLTEASLEMVKADMGIMSMAKWALQPHIKNNSIKAVKVGKNGLKRKHFIATRANETYPDYFQHFINFLQNEINLQWNI
ncbi:LysR family transcriptional regulator [Flavobacterium johnsoniae]|uniref:Transcriptional regulator, LysR family n=1 Tax=Flavobacterium johnsoniae (strain ATCC 17061 / DSM 2064 / JCM 8514 / BCRC 14874 / CCUG 350202 / NBRC 14942 / NCIMB 11054 / UW101) TaxID=376686 RepID=A5FLL4_FLAJ1|nr:LysR family transcriptional regulator [Flavobacterium johnsoniae]ABQ03907.1 transcriptional regulator, LysR family [Flavobacterium johnsoniae UW101]OXE96223.1 LysR family transcriptional regulator [Flavobacterium johnsoniae UW101]WQG79227.1 LysR family transcriptional regulator [Flavobacterium johnsoniae UW101]SHK06253.1 transcriptional regulator, LysR family [Flavobacterium johnsoniae]